MDGEGDELYDYYNSDESESEYWARRIGRRVSSQILVDPDCCLLPRWEGEEEVYWYRPGLTDSPSYPQLHRLASRMLTLMQACSSRRDAVCEQSEATENLLPICS